jgi:hypothetical protein
MELSHFRPISGSGRFWVRRQRKAPAIAFKGAEQAALIEIAGAAGRER